MPALFALDAWQVWLTVVAGAGSTLCGLVFVGLALNLEHIKRSPALVGRAGEAITLLLSTLVLALACLVPHAPPRQTALHLLVLGLVLWAVVVRIQIAAYQEQKVRFLGYHILRVCLGQLALLPTIVAGISLLAGSGGGMAWLAFGLVMSIVVGVFDAWVLAVEIVR
jgi:hypothetical protein